MAAEISVASPRFVAEIEHLPWRMVKLNSGDKEAVCPCCPEEHKVLWSAWMA